MLAYMDDEERGDDELEKIRTTLEEADEKSLVAWWRGSVGEWLDSRDDIEDSDKQFRKLVTGEPRRRQR